MIGVLGAGAFGTALSVVWAEAGHDVFLWGRNPQIEGGENPRLPGIQLPKALRITDDMAALSECGTLVAAVPTQALGPTLAALPVSPKTLVAACKGIDLSTGEGPTRVIERVQPKATPALLSGPSFAIDIARHLPTALALACRDPEVGRTLQHDLSTQTLRLYRVEDTTGVEVAGALKNVIAIACGAAIGAGLGASARAALMSRGFAEVRRLALALGARDATLSGLAGFGDLALTCTSETSRNYQFGLSLGRGEPGSATATVEGKTTALAARELGRKHKVDLPITDAVCALVSGSVTLDTVKAALLARALKEE